MKPLGPKFLGNQNIQEGEGFHIHQKKMTNVSFGLPECYLWCFSSGNHAAITTSTKTLEIFSHYPVLPPCSFYPVPRCSTGIPTNNRTKLSSSEYGHQDFSRKRTPWVQGKTMRLEIATMEKKNFTTTGQRGDHQRCQIGAEMNKQMCNELSFTAEEGWQEELT